MKMGIQDKKILLKKKSSHQHRSLFLLHPFLKMVRQIHQGDGYDDVHQGSGQTVGVLARKNAVYGRWGRNLVMLSLRGQHRVRALDSDALWRSRVDLSLKGKKRGR